MDYAQPKQNLYGFELPNADPFRVEQVAGVLHCSNQHIHSLVAANELAGNNIAPVRRMALWRITRESLVAFIQRRTTGPFDEVDFQAMEAPLSLALPETRMLRVKHIADVLHCSVMHVVNLIDSLDLVATNIALSESGKATYRIPRAALVHFLKTRTEGTY